MKFLSLVLMGFVSFSAMAAGTHSCDGLDSIANLIGETKSFGEGGVKVAYVSTEEPAVAPDHLLVFVYDNEMGYTCTAISRDSDGNGFGFVDMNSLKGISYDAKKGVLFSVKVTLPVYEDFDDEIDIRTLKIRANQATGVVTLE